MAAAAMMEPPSRWAWMVPRTNGYSGSGVTAVEASWIATLGQTAVAVVRPGAPGERVGAARHEIPLDEVSLPVPELHRAAGRSQALDGVEVVVVRDHAVDERRGADRVDGDRPAEERSEHRDGSRARDECGSFRHDTSWGGEPGRHGELQRPCHMPGPAGG